MEKTPTQINKEIIDLKRDHEKLKKEILDELAVFEEHINKKYSKLETIEKEYVELMGKLVEVQ